MARNKRSMPIDGSMTWGMKASFVFLSRYSMDLPEAFWIFMRSKSVR